MIAATLVERFLVACFWLSPYKWMDVLLERLEGARRDRDADWEAVRRVRYAVSEAYITLWLVAAVALWLGAALIPVWVAWLALLRVFGILAKELGVILFGKCKITEGHMVAASGRAIVLALTNYAAAGFLFGFVYARLGRFAVGDRTAVTLDTPDALVQALTIHFSLGPAYTPADTASWALVVGQMGFAFLFSVIVISLFISLLNIGAKRV